MGGRIGRRSDRGPVRVRGKWPPRSAPRASPPSSRARFASNDAYRASREWQRYEGTAQRELFLQLRRRFLRRHAPAGRWVLDAGSGPGRFTADLGAPGTARRVAVDLGREMLVELIDRWPRGNSADPIAFVVRGDAGQLPFPPATFDVVAALGNLVGFAGMQAPRVLGSVVDALAPGGTLLLEVAPGSGEHSRYLRRLPSSSVARLLRAPTRAVATRIQREGFAPEPVRKEVPGEFVRVDPVRLAVDLTSKGFRVEEMLAVAPALGADGDRTAAVARDPKAWEHLLMVEEQLGRTPERWSRAAAVLVAATAPGDVPPVGASVVAPKRRIK